MAVHDAIEQYGQSAEAGLLLTVRFDQDGRSGSVCMHRWIF